MTLEEKLALVNNKDVYEFTDKLYYDDKAYSYIINLIHEDIDDHTHERTS